MQSVASPLNLSEKLQMRGKQKEEEEAPLYGDLLELVLSNLPLLDLLSASCVSKTWQKAVSSTLRNPSRAKPWLILHLQNTRSPSATESHAYDPHSREWIKIPQPHNTPALPLRSSHSSLLYTFSSSTFSISSDPLNAGWHHLEAPQVWRLDPIVALVGSHLVVAGGTYDFEEDPLAVEVYDTESCIHYPCESMPSDFKYFASAVWLSVAASDRKMYVLEKNSGEFCWFDVETKQWGKTINLRPDPLVFSSVIGFSLSDNKLVQLGLVGHACNIKGLRIWEVNCDTFDRKLIGEMPSDLLERLKNAGLTLHSIDISLRDKILYVYNPSDPREIFICDLDGGARGWDYAVNSVVNNTYQMGRLVFTCSTVGIEDLRRVLQGGSPKLPLDFAGN